MSIRWVGAEGASDNPNAYIITCEECRKEAQYIVGRGEGAYEVYLKAKQDGWRAPKRNRRTHVCQACVMSWVMQR